MTDTPLEQKGIRNAIAAGKYDKYIPWLFVLFFLVVFAVNGFFVYVAIKTHTGIIAKGTYEQGRHFNQELEAAREQAKLGISHVVSFKDGKLTWKLMARDMESVTGAKVSVLFFRNVQSGYDFTVPLEEKSDGRYEAVINFPLKGKWTAKLEAQWKDRKYRASHTIIVP